MKIVISSGHGLKVRGASGLIDEVDEARNVVDRLQKILGDTVTIFHDDVSTTQNENLNRIVNFHNSQTRDLDISVHFNAYTYTDGGRGTEVLYLTQQELAERVSLAISNAGGLINRGAQKRSDLFFLNGTDEPAILIEVCFVDAKADVEAYEKNFDAICQAIADLVPRESFEEESGGIKTRGKVSWFGGPNDTGVSPDEGLAFIYSYDEAPELFLPTQPPGTTGLARRLNPDVSYIAMRWDYDIFPKEDLASGELLARVYAPSTDRALLARPADWGPHTDTGRVADISKGLMDTLGIGTDDEVEVTFPVSPAEPAKTSRL
jgi:N-acetylmuramoyl-L-alanine amidase